MIFASFLTILLYSSCWAADENSSDDEIPFVISPQGTSDNGIPFVGASQGNSDESKVSNLLPELDDPVAPPLLGTQPTSKGRSDIEIEDDKPSGGYVYPKPAIPLTLPEFKTLDAAAPLVGLASFAEENSQRQPRSPQRRRRPYNRPDRPPPFIPGFIPPNQIRPLPALYGRPYGY